MATSSTESRVSAGVSTAVAVAVAASIAVGAQPAAAQDEGGGGQGPAVINLEETVVEGRLQKPEAFYILQHSNLNYKALQPKQSFLPKLIESVEREPF